MKIELSYPFISKWRFGYLVTNKEPRRNIILFNSKSERSTISYARYLISVQIGRFLEPHEHVDHIDNDKLNDVIENLQILTKQENNTKAAKTRGAQRALIRCPICIKIFSISKGNSQLIPSLAGKITCCSRDCSYKFKKLNLTPKERCDISEKSLLKIYIDHNGDFLAEGADRNRLGLPI